MSIQTISSFPPIESKPYSTYYNQRMSVLGAVNRLKEMENRVVQMENRELVQKRISEALMVREYGREKSQANNSAIRRSINLDKSLREIYITRRISQQNKLHSLVQQSRKTKIKFRQQLKSALKLNNSHVYSNAVTQRSKNQQLIKEFKEREMLLKRENRGRVIEGEEKSREKVKQFKEIKVGEIRKKREQDVQQLQKKIMMRSRYLEKSTEDKSVNNNSKAENIRSRSFMLTNSNSNNISFSTNKVQNSELQQPNSAQLQQK